MKNDDILKEIEKFNNLVNEKPCSETYKLIEYPKEERVFLGGSTSGCSEDPFFESLKHNRREITLKERLEKKYNGVSFDEAVQLFKKRQPQIFNGKK